MAIKKLPEKEDKLQNTEEFHRVILILNSIGSQDTSTSSQMKKLSLTQRKQQKATPAQVTYYKKY